jgi:hypothetical protein
MITIDVIRPIRVPAGATLDGAVLADATWAHKGKHTIDAATLAANDWEQRGYLEALSEDGKPIVWGACCSGHA